MLGWLLCLHFPLSFLKAIIGIPWMLQHELWLQSITVLKTFICCVLEVWGGTPAEADKCTELRVRRGGSYKTHEAESFACMHNMGAESLCDCTRTSTSSSRPLTAVCRQDSSHTYAPFWRRALKKSFVAGCTKPR